MAHPTDNLSAFCREHNLRRSHIAEVASGLRKSYKGWSLPPDATKPEIPTPDDTGSMTVGQVIEMAEIAARASGDPAYEKLVMGRIEKLRKGMPLEVLIKEE